MRFSIPRRARSSEPWVEVHGEWRRDQYHVLFAEPHHWDVLRDGHPFARAVSASAGRDIADEDRRRRWQRGALVRNGAVFTAAVVAAMLIAGVIQASNDTMPAWALPGLILAVAVASWTGVTMTLVLLRMWRRAMGKHLRTR